MSLLFYDHFYDYVNIERGQVQGQEQFGEFELSSIGGLYKLGNPYRRVMIYKEAHRLVRRRL